MTPPTIGVGMIVRNAEDNLAACLDSFKDHVDQIVIVLGGKSTDRTREIAESYTSEVYDFHGEEFEDGSTKDFSVARNFAFSFLTTDWLFWVDGDDVVAGAENLHNVVSQAEAGGYGSIQLQYDYRHDDQGHCTVSQNRERLLKRDLGWEWHYRVHEVCDAKTQHKVGRDDSIVIVHTNDTPNTERNLRLLAIMEQELPNDPRVLGALADTYSSIGENQKAIEYGERYFMAESHGDARWTCATELARVYIRLQNWQMAEQWCFVAISQHPEYQLPYLLLSHIAWFGYHDADRALLYISDADNSREEAPFALFRQPLDYTLNRWDTEWRCYADRNEWVKAKAILESALAYRGIGTVSVAKGNNPWVANYWYVFERTRCEASIIGTLSIVDHLCRRGDTLRARHLLENDLPLPVRDDPRIVKAYRRICEFTKHVELGNDADYQAFYEHNHSSPEDPSAPMNGTIFESYRMEPLVARLKARGVKRILDVGCGAGAPAMYLADQGFSVVGLDINAPTVKEANKRAKAKYGKTAYRRAKFVQGSFETKGSEDLGKFDAVIMMELLEHVHPNTVSFYLSSAEDFLNPGGAVFFTTPGMAIGDIPGLWEDFPRDHVQEFSRQDLEKLILASPSRRVKRPINLHKIYDPEVVVPGFASWFAEYEWYKPDALPENWGKPVVIYTGPGLEDWTPDMPDKVGMGGSETWAAKTAEELASRGHPVVLYGMVNGVYNGVIYRHYSSFDPKRPFAGEKAWLCMVSRHLGILDERPNADHVLFMAHDVDYGAELTPERLGNMNRYCVLSDWQDAHTTVKYDEWPAPLFDEFVDKMVRFSNAIEPSFFDGDVDRIPHSFIWSSSPDRGLDVLLRWWPQIREVFPDAALDIFYGWENVNAMMDSRPWLAEFKQQIIALAAQDGVKWHGRVGQRQLAQEAMKHQFWLYPSVNAFGEPWHETFCITALEMQMAGVIPIMPSAGALPERFYFGTLLNGEQMDMGQAVDSLQWWDEHPPTSTELSAVRTIIADEYNWQAVTDRLLSLCGE